MFKSMCRIGVTVIVLFSTFSAFSALHAQVYLGSWSRNTTGATGYNGLPADVDSVLYSDSSFYVGASGIPSYNIGPWPTDPNVATDQHYLFRFPRYPVPETGPKVATPLGAIGLFINGVPMYNAEDGKSYDNQGIWHRNAVVVEASSFDSTGGHPDGFGAYHYHQNPRGMYTMDSTKFSPLLGYAFDGYPVYGPYAYKNADGTGGIVRMTSSYQLRDMTTRTNGPAVDSQYPLGYFVEDYEYVPGSGTLDQYNGRFAVTPQYPNGTYAYYITVDSAGKSAYPYILGPDYYGVPEREDFHTTRVTITEPVTLYTGQSTAIRTGITAELPTSPELLQSYPNPFNPTTVVTYELPSSGYVTLKILDILGRAVATLADGRENAGTHKFVFDGSKFASGIYFARLEFGGRQLVKEMALIK